MQTFINEHPFLFGFISWTVAVTLLCYANYRHHKRRKTTVQIEDFEHPTTRFWDRAAFHDDIFLNQN
jgi:hypothetical protein